MVSEKECHHPEDAESSQEDVPKAESVYLLNNHIKQNPILNTCQTPERYFLGVFI